MANSYLNRTQSSATSDKIGTFSAWIKLSSFSDAVFSGHTDSSNRIALYFSDTLRIYGATGGSQSVYLITSQVFKDPSAFYHIVVAWDTTQGTAANRFKIYVNGSQITSFSTASYPSQDADVYWNKGTTSIVGARFVSSITDYFDGYMSHASFVDGQALAPTVFGETDSSSGIWKFKFPSGVTWGNNGFHLKFESSGNLGLDSSGNSNTFTVNGNGRQALDTPSNVYATWNPLSRSTGNVYSNGNTTVAYSNNYQKNANATLTFNNGKWYAEFKRGGAANLHIGIVGNTFLEDGRIVTDTSSNHTYNMRGHTGCVTLISNSSDQDIYVDGSDSGTNVDFYSAAGDIVMVAFDSATKKIWFGKNGTWSGSGNPATGANASLTYSGTATSDFTFGTDTENGSSCSANFGSGYFGTTAISSAGSNGNGSLFEYDVPSGYYALNTKNINTYG